LNRGGSLRRRLFFWYAATIVLAMASGVLVYWATSAQHPHEMTHRAVRLVANRLARHWDSERERDQLTHDIADSLAVNVEVRDETGHLLVGVGACADAHYVPAADVMRDGKRLGHVALCRRKPSAAHGLRFWLGISVTVLVLWMMAGALSRKILGPLEELERTARDLGNGNLASRVQLDRAAFGEVGQLARTFNEMAKRLEDQLAVERELLAAVSHEVRSPLGRMRVLLELGRSQGLDPDRIERLEREVTEIDELVAQLLANARLDFGTPTLRPEPIGDFLGDLVERSEDSPRVDDETDNAEVWFDPSSVGRAFSNLLSNARTHGGGATRVRAYLQRDQLHVDVLDEGPGFGDADTTALFEPFTSGTGESGGESSLGLGLSLVARVARAHGGSAYARNREPRGACVGFSIRMREASAEDAREDERDRWSLRANDR
jgi:signal transduction histidine kinase